MTPAPDRVAMPELPEMLARVAFFDGPWLPEQGRVCLLHDTAGRRWGATARLTATGVGLASALGCEGLLPGVGSVLATQGGMGGIDRASVLLRTTSVPDRGDVVHETFLTVSAPDAALRRGAVGVTRGPEARAYVLYPALEALAWPLAALGLDTPRWLDSPSLIEALHAHLVRGPEPADDLDRSGGPGTGHGASHRGTAARSFAHDGHATVSWVVVPTAEGQLPVESLSRLLTTTNTGERRSVAVHYQAAHPGPTQPSGARPATDDGHARPSRTVATVDPTSSPVRYGAVAAVTLPAGAGVETAADAVEGAAAGGLVLHRLELAQDSGFVAATLPVGIGVERLRGRR